MTTEASPATPEPNQPPWFTIALGEIGTREVAGNRDNARILEYFSTTTIPKNDLHDETAWCSAFANWCVREAGLSGTRKANARSWMAWGEELTEPRLGCVCVFWRGSPDAATGHVAFYVGQDERNVYVLGGNQSNAVNVSAYPKPRLLAYRWPAP